MNEGDEKLRSYERKRDHNNRKDLNRFKSQREEKRMNEGDEILDGLDKQFSKMNTKDQMDFLEMGMKRLKRLMK